jgi:hypothetical protein
MHFVTNTIHTKSKVPTLSEVFKAARTQAALGKTASANGTVKTAANIAQVQQEIREAGEPGKANPKNLTAPKFGPGGKKGKEDEACSCGKSSCKECTASKIASLQRVAAEEDEGETSGQPQAEAKLVNDPNKDPKLSEGQKSNGKGKEKDEGESSGQLDVEPLHQKGESTDEKPGSLETLKTKDAKTVANALKKTARFKRFSELTPKQKEFLRGVYSIYWPKEFIDSLLAAK